MMSLPLRMPLSKRTVRSSPTASAIGPSASSEAIAPSTWRPPWLETTIPSMPRATASRASSTCWMPLSEYRQRGQLAQPAEVVPGQRGIDVDAEVVAGRGADVLLGGLLEVVAEDRVLEEVGDPHALQEREPGLLQVARLPAGDEGVDGDDDRAVPGRLGPPDEALDVAALGGPVELEPARRVPSGLGDLLEREVRCGAGDHRHAEAGRRARRRQLAVLVDDLLHADRRQQQRRRHLGPENGGREVAFGDVAQHSRDEAMPREGGAVGVHRLLGPGAGEDVGGRVGIHLLRGAALELGDRDRDRGRLAAEPAGVDLAVVVGRIRHGARLFIDWPR